MRSPGRRAVLLALATSGLLWGTTVPLTKVALAAGWGPAWLTVVRFGLAALPLAWVARRGLRDALTRAVAGAGVLGYGVAIVLQNAGSARTSVSHAALLIGATPVAVALVVAATGQGRVGRAGWCGLLLALAGVGFVSMDGGGVATLAGDALVLLSVLPVAVFFAYQPRLLAGRDPLAVTAVQLGAAALATVPYAAWSEGAPGGTAPASVVALAIAGTLVPYALFAWAQTRISPAVAGAYLNLEPLVAVGLGVAAFDDPLTANQLLGGLAVLGGIALPQMRFTIASARRSVVSGPNGRNSDGSVSSSSASSGAPSGPGMRSTRA